MDCLSNIVSTRIIERLVLHAGESSRAELAEMKGTNQSITLFSLDHAADLKMHVNPNHHLRPIQLEIRKQNF
jgi:hypothetical protein